MESDRNREKADAKRPLFHPLFVNDELQNIGPCVVSAGVEFHAAGRNLIHIQTCVNDLFFVPDWFCRIMTIGVYDTASAPADNIIQIVNFFRAVKTTGVHIPREIHIAVDEVAAALNSNMADGGLPLLIVIGIGRDV